MKKYDFYTLKNQIQEEFTPNQVYSWAQKHFLLRPFKIHKINFIDAQRSFEKIKQKYDQCETQIKPNQWYKNERKIFIEIFIWYCLFNKVLPPNIEQAEYEKIGQLFFNKNPIFIKFQVLNLLKVDHKQLWKQTQDESLMAAVRNLGEGNWNLISKQIFFETESKIFITPKQCRERWFNHLSTRIKREKWSELEDLTILNHVLIKDKRWCEIARQLKNTRTEHMVKNRYMCLIKAQTRENRHREIKQIENMIKKLHKKITEIENHPNSQFTQNLKLEESPHQMGRQPMHIDQQHSQSQILRSPGQVQPYRYHHMQNQELQRNFSNPSNLSNGIVRQIFQTSLMVRSVPSEDSLQTFRYPPSVNPYFQYDCQNRWVQNSIVNSNLNLFYLKNGQEMSLWGMIIVQQDTSNRL